MSQSDYIQYLKVSNELKTISKLPPILDAGNYTEYLEYAIENKVVNTKQVNSQLTLPTQRIIYNIPTIDVSGCPVFLTCQNTNLRTNRKLRPYSGFCFPLRPLTSKQISQQTNASSCNCSI